MLKMDPDFAGRYLNDGFSGGEKKRTEVLQMAILEPEIAILDEIDSGLDIDALRIVSEGINILVDQTHMGVLIITHYQRLLDYIKPQAVHVMMDGQIVRTGDANLALELDEKGYDWIRQEQTTAKDRFPENRMDNPQKYQLQGIDDADYEYGFQDPDISVFRTEAGLNEKVVRQISAMKEEPEWMLEFRLKSLKHFWSGRCRLGVGFVRIGFGSSRLLCPSDRKTAK